MLGTVATERSFKCPSCGHSHTAERAPRRCASCGAPVRELLIERALEARRQNRFSFSWLLVSLLITALLTAAVIVGLPLVAHVLDFEGSAGMLVAIPVWFTSGMLVGLISPGRTFVEPACAAALVAVPTVLLLLRSETVKTMPLFLYLLFAALGVFFAWIGSVTGERVQMGPPPKTFD
jgi:hypothetical protein